MHTYNAVVGGLIANAPMAGLRMVPRMPVLSGVVADFLEQLLGIDRSGRELDLGGTSRRQYSVARLTSSGRQTPTTPTSSIDPKDGGRTWRSRALHPWSRMLRPWCCTFVTS